MADNVTLNTMSGGAVVRAKQISGNYTQIAQLDVGGESAESLVSTFNGIPLATATPIATTSLASNLVLKASAGTLFSFQVFADSTLSANQWYVMIFNATTFPSDGPVTPIKVYAVPAGAIGTGAVFNAGGLAMSTGIVIGVSTSGPFTLASSIHAYISGDFT